MKYCKGCEIELDDSKFHKDKSRKDGLQRLCKVCNKDRVLEYYHADRNGAKAEYARRARETKTKFQERVDALKAERGCYFCSEKEPVCLDFHHIADKDDAVSNLVAKKNWSIVIKEIDKCIVACSNCHRKLHAGLLKYPRQDSNPHLVD
jgi:hypothetical protein